MRERGAWIAKSENYLLIANELA